MSNVSPERFIEFVKRYLEIMLSTTKELEDLYSEYADVLEKITNPSVFAEYVSSLSDEDAGKLFKAVMSLAGLAETLAKASAMQPETVRELRTKLENALRLLTQ